MECGTYGPDEGEGGRPPPEKLEELQILQDFQGFQLVQMLENMMFSEIPNTSDCPKHVKQFKNIIHCASHSDTRPGNKGGQKLQNASQVTKSDKMHEKYPKVTKCMKKVPQVTKCMKRDQKLPNAWKVTESDQMHESYQK